MFAFEESRKLILGLFIFLRFTWYIMLENLFTYSFLLKNYIICFRYFASVNHNQFGWAIKDENMTFVVYLKIILGKLMTIFISLPTQNTFQKLVEYLSCFVE